MTSSSSSRTNRRVVSFVASLVVAGALVAGTLPGTQAASHAGDNVVLQWNNAALAGVRASTLGPPMAARALAIVHTCIYDAWAAYDPRAVGTRLGGSLRRPAAERIHPNIDRAISFAAYRAATDLMPASTFSDAADEAGISRRYGGIHFAQGDFDARATGRRCGELAFAKAWALFNGANYPY